MNNTHQRLYNLGFMPVTDVHISFLNSAGLSVSLGDKKNQLPMISTSEESGTVKFMVTETVNNIDVKESDIYIISGIPDVGYYVIEALLARIKGKFIPMILIPLGRHIGGSFKVLGFRQICVQGMTEKPFHYVSQM